MTTTIAMAKKIIMKITKSMRTEITIPMSMAIK
jgi:hypothetical protein